ERASLPDPQPAERGSELNAPVVLKKYRFAAACTGEFSQQNGGTKQAVLAKVVDVTNKLNAIYERDLDIRLELVANNDLIIFLDPATDPYTGTTTGEWLGQNPLAMVQYLGSADQYDIGHVFARYLGGSQGVAMLGSCCTQFKGRGCSAGYPPYEDDFFSIIGQEIGHQWDALHTWNSCGGLTEPFPDAERCEPGSGTTIMSYSGGCGGDNVKSGNADLYYNICSIVAIRTFVEIGNGSTCGTNITTDNNPPVVTIPYPNNFFIPISTPFELTGAAEDPDGDPLDYCWEGIDVGPLVPLGSAVGSSPIFRSYPPVSTPTRTFPRIQTIISNQSSITEILPTYSRDMSFALTVRDNRTGGGGVGVDTVRFKATDLAGPFVVTYPSGAFATWKQGEYVTVTWDVANTDKAPVNCRKVNIRLSLNGGSTYPVTLASNVANTGQYCIQVPNDVATPLARVRVEAADNVFFDISNSNFKIEAATEPGFTFCPAGLYDTVCLPAAYSTVISTSSSSGYSEPITLSAAGLPAGVTASFSPNPVAPGESAVMTLDFPVSQTETTFGFTLKAASGSITDSLTNTITVYFNDFTGLSMKAPADGASGLDRAPVLKWNAVVNANTYEVEVATSPSFAPGTLVATGANITTDSFKIVDLLDKGSVYYWRFRPKNECGAGDWLGPFAFATLVDVCAAFESVDVPKNITASAIVTVEAKINVPAGGVISDVNIPRIQGYHAFFKDLEMHLISPMGKDVLLFKDKCPNYNGNFNFGFDDSKPAIFTCPPPNNGTVYKPTEALSAFNGDAAGGTWTLRVKDNVISSGGALVAFDLELCSSTTLNPPMLVNNNPLQVAPGANAGIPTDLLKTEDANNSDDELVYTLMTVPQHGKLELFWTGDMKPGDQFTQADLNNNGLRYFDFGGISGADAFCFTVTDGEGGLIKDCFTIQQFPVRTSEAVRSLVFALAPNPANETVRLMFGETLRSDTRVRVFDAAGRLLQTEQVAAGQVMAQLDIARLPEGLYAVSVENAEGSGVRKLIVR
ncbi:MAG: T9SS type A sorting domain-containing protein, partial [Bacteroidetes bacterium]